jgi:hypothetical protein
MSREKFMKPTVILVGADKGGVGKTTLARTLLDYLSRKNVMARCYDTEWPRGTLKRFYPATTEVIDMSNVAHQMKLLDTLETASLKVSVVDLKAGNLSMVLDIFDRIGVLEAAKSGKFTLGLFHVVGPAIASLEEIGEIAKYIQGTDYVIAKNFINETNFLEWDEKSHKKYFSNPGAAEIVLPKLNEMAYEQVDLAGVTFRDFIDNKAANGEPGNFSFVLRGYVRKWMSEIDAQLEKLKPVQELVRGERSRAPPQQQAAAAAKA